SVDESNKLLPLEKSGTCQLDPPNRSALVERTFRFDEGRGFAFENPHVRVWGLLPHHMCQQPSGTSDFHFHNVVPRFMLDDPSREVFLALWKDHKLHEPRLWCGRYH